MFESFPAPAAEVDTMAVSAFGRELARLAPGDETGLVEGLTVLEDLKSAAAAAQCRLAEALDRVVREREASAGLPADRRGRGVAAQVALARRDSPVSGGRHLGTATALVREMPLTLAALQDSRLSEWRAVLLVRETACLSREDRTAVDHELCADPATLAGLGDRAVAEAARRAAYRLDPQAVADRASKAAKDRRVTLRPAPDTMTNLTGLLPVAGGVAAYAALCRAADQARAAGDTRSRGQVMADTLVERLTGQAHAEQVPLEVAVVVTDRSLLGVDDEPATVPGYGPVPAGWARDSAARAAHATLRRLLTEPATGQLVAMESRSRQFPRGLRRFLDLRDQTCRTPWCGAPVRHIDHVVPDAEGGATSAANGQGLCEACNYVKQLPGWASREGPASRLGDHRVETLTPTGHVYRSRAPAAHAPLDDATTAATAAGNPTLSDSLLERELAHVLGLHTAA
jgi:hypothetical protein